MTRMRIPGLPDSPPSSDASRQNFDAAVKIILESILGRRGPDGLFLVQSDIETITAEQLAAGAALANLAAASIPSDRLAAGAAVANLGYTPVNKANMAGAVMHFAMAAAPSGWLVANAAAVSRTTYATLFAAIGTTFGVGNGTTTFNLPELRGEFLRGLDGGRGVDSGRALGSAQGDLVKDHKHAFDVATCNGTGPYNNRLAEAQDGSGSFTSENIGQSVTSGGLENRPRNVALLACICTGD